MQNENVVNAETQAEFERFYNLLTRMTATQRKMVLQILKSEEAPVKAKDSKNKKAR